VSGEYEGRRSRQGDAGIVGQPVMRDVRIIREGEILEIVVRIEDRRIVEVRDAADRGVDRCGGDRAGGVELARSGQGKLTRKHMMVVSVSDTATGS
jgi:hypothetical protein